MKISYLLLPILLLITLLACKPEHLQPDAPSIQFDGETRTYLIHVPDSYDGQTEVPLLFCFHGYTSTSSRIRNYSNFDAIADTANFIVVYPQGLKLKGSTHWNVGGWTTESTVDDLGFVNALLDSLMTNYTIDSSRVYSTGMSNGGFMSFLLACQLSERIAAVASVTGLMTPETFDQCAPQHPMPVLQLHGLKDGIVPYDGSEDWTQSVVQVLDYWRVFNNNAAADTTFLENNQENNFAEQYIYPQGDNQVEVQHYKILTGRHRWFGTHDFKPLETSKIVWEFLAQYDIEGKR